MVALPINSQDKSISLFNIRFGDTVKVDKSAGICLSLQRVLEDIDGFPEKK